MQRAVRGREASAALAPEPTFEEAQSWWSRMQRPVTFTGVPRHPLQAAVLWNAGLLFCSNPREYREGRLRLGSQFSLAPGLSRELEGHELDALQVEFSFGRKFHLPDRLDNRRREITQELLEGRMPVVISRLSHQGIEWTCTAFSRVAPSSLLDGGQQEPWQQALLTEVHWVARNPGARARQAELHCHLTMPHVVLGYKVKMEESASAYPRSLSWEAPLVVDDRGRARLAAVAGDEGEAAFLLRLPEQDAERAEQPISSLGLAENVLRLRARIAGGASASWRLIIPFYATDPEVLHNALRVAPHEALERTRSHWPRAFAGASISTPEKIVNECFDAYLYHAMIATGRKPKARHCILKCSPSNYEGVWSAHSAIAAYSMDLRGQHGLSREVLETFLNNQGPLPDSILKLFTDKQVGESEGFSSHPGFLGNIEGFMAIIWSFYHGWIMWAIGRHARLTGDWAWLRRHADRLILACEWIEAQRERTRIRDSRGRRVLSYGLLPAANAFDWGFGHMFWSDAHTYRGLKEMAECLQRLGYPKARLFLAQAEDYRNDIVNAVTRSRDASPPVPLEDGGEIPFVPMSVEMRDYFAPDWTYVACGPLNLAWAGVVPADHEITQQVTAFLEAGRPLGTWDESKEKHQGWDWPASVPADEGFLERTRPDVGRCHLWRHKMTYEPGWIPQAFAFLERDDMPALLEHFYSLISNGGQHVDVRSPVEQRDGVPWTQPGDANLLWLMRSMLVREEGDELILAGSCPRSWYADGQTIGVTGLPTHFGPVSYQISSHVTDGRMTGTFQFQFRERPGRLLVRLRHPAGALPKRVKLNGRLRRVAASEWVEISPACRRLEADY